MLPLLLLLLATAHGLPEELPYTPKLAPKSLEGRITSTTFVLEQPRCVFDFLENDSDTMIWLVVAVPKAAGENFNNSLGPGSPERAFQNFPNQTDAYITLGVTIDHYPCDTTTKSPEEITVLRVGADTSCTQDKTKPTCNGPLPAHGTYQVKFLAFNGSEPVAETNWSEPITLKRVKPFRHIPVRHSAGMIALTTILSILFAILLAGLVAMLISGGVDSCGSSSFTKPDMVTVQRYNTHHVYDQPAARL